VRNLFYSITNRAEHIARTDGTARLKVSADFFEVGQRSRAVEELSCKTVAPPKRRQVLFGGVSPFARVRDNGSLIV